MLQLKLPISSSPKKLSDNKAGSITGRCLCGGVSVVLDVAVHSVGVCHCNICRRWTSGPWMALQVPDATVVGESLKTFKSSSFAERGFCRICGAHIFHRPKLGRELAVSAGLFADPAQYIDREIFTDSQPRYYGFTNRGSRRSALSMAIEWLPKLIVRQIARWLGASR
jgi:hypothetical protein